MFKYSLREIQALKKSLAPRVRHVLSRCVKFLEYSFEFMFHPLNSNWMQISTQHAWSLYGNLTKFHRKQIWHTNHPTHLQASQNTKYYKNKYSQNKKQAPQK